MSDSNPKNNNHSKTCEIEKRWQFDQNDFYLRWTVFHNVICKKIKIQCSSQSHETEYPDTMGNESDLDSSDENFKELVEGINNIDRE